MKKHLIMLLLLAALLLLSACGGSPSADPEYTAPIVVGFSQVGAESDWRNANTRSMQTALSAANGFRLILDDAQQKKERQITALRNFIHQGVDYIVLAPTTEDGWDTVLYEARAAGIPVIIIDRMIYGEGQIGLDENGEPLFTCWIGSDFRTQGDKAVRWMEDTFGDEPLHIVHLQGNYGSSAQIGRTASLDAGLAANPHWTLVARDSGDFTQAKAQEIIGTLLARGVSFNVIFAENDNMAYGAIEALKAAGLTPGVDVHIISFDANQRALEMVLTGEISCNVECNPLHGPRVLEVIMQLERGETPPRYTYVEEGVFTIDGLTQDIIDSRGY
ncbi:MAG: ABC transporter substrate-binding protein [Clostridia bacterium]|nr:ABC transporter substrate-binding protein [Clostridia bacterium]